MDKIWFKFFIATALFGAIGQLGHTQTLPPNAGEIQRTMPPAPEMEPGHVPSISIEEPTLLQVPDSFKIEVQGWKITGASQIPESESQEKLHAYVGRELGINELRQAARELAFYFRQRGLVVRCFLPEQRIENGIVEIRVIEGRLSDVTIEDPQQLLSAEQVTQTITQAQPMGEIVQMPNLERGILLLGDLPGVAVSPVLKAGEHFGESALGLKLEPRQLIDGSVYYGNSGMRAVGQNVYGGNLNLNNPLRVGDQASLQVQGGSSNVFGRVSYSLPVGYSGLRIGVRGSGMNYDLDALFSKLEATGESWNGGAFASYPLWRSMDFNLNAQAGFDNRRYSSKQLQKLTNDTQLNVGYAGLDLNSRDDLLGGGVNALGFTTYIGDADLSDNSENLTLDRRTARSNGGYQKFVFNASRLQQLSEDFSFRTDLSGQIATRNLYSGEKFALGGPYGVRAYPVNEGLGDEGYLAKFELRYKAHDYVQLFGFIDTGGTTLHVNPWGQSKIPSHYTLSGGGLGIDLIVPKQFEINFSVAQRIGSNPAATNTGKDNDGSNRTPHFWLQINKFF